jgi:hypothetical protein
MVDNWFPNPLDSMPIATDSLDTSPSDMQPPGVDEEPPHITIHEKMYRLATQHHTTIGGSENVK